MLIDPNPADARALRVKGESFAWKISEELLDREMQELGHQPAADASLPLISVEDAPRVLDRANQQIMSLLSHLRHARSAQQPNHAAQVLVEVESRLVAVARLLNSHEDAQQQDGLRPGMGR